MSVRVYEYASVFGWPDWKAHVCVSGPRASTEQREADDNDGGGSGKSHAVSRGVEAQVHLVTLRRS